MIHSLAITQLYEVKRHAESEEPMSWDAVAALTGIVSLITALSDRRRNRK
jgi:hypothetical protein